MSDTDVDGTVEGQPSKKKGVFRSVYQSTNDFDFVKTYKIGLLIGALISVVSLISLFTLEL